MAAPGGTIWGSIVGNYGRIGIYVSLTSTNTQTTATVEVWFWSKYSVIDEFNTLYFDNLSAAGSVTTSRGAVEVFTSIEDGTGWSEYNQQKIATYTYTYKRINSSATRYLYAKLADIDRVGGTMYAQNRFVVPGLPAFTVSYHPNGGTGSPGMQTKIYGNPLTLSSTKPTMSGYTFQGWATSASGSVAYAPGASYTANEDVKLYAVWEVNTYTVTYNANGGTGAPASRTKTHGTALTLSSTKPTRTNYAFKGWGTSASTTTVAYAAGASYTNNVDVTLYAIWELSYTKPKISNLSATRCDSAGTLTDEGTYALIGFKWSSSLAVSSIVIDWVDAVGTVSGSKTVSASGTSGTVSQLVGNGSFNVEKSYTFTVTVTDNGDSTDRSTTMSGSEYHIDYSEHSVAIGKSAETLLNSAGNAENTFDVNWRTRLRNNVGVGDKLYYHDGKQGIFLSWEGFMHLQRTSAQGYHPYIGFYLDDATAANGQIRLNSITKVMEFLSAAGYKFGNNVEMAGHLDFSTSQRRIYGVDPNGVRKACFEPQNQNGNTIVGWDNYDLASGNTGIYGHDLVFGVSNIPSPGTYRPYRRRGDSYTFVMRTAGYVTNGGKEVSFWIPQAMPIIGSPTVTVTSGAGFALRQGNKYTHGSSASATVSPDSYEAIATMFNGIYVKAVFSNTTNVTNNDAIGIYWNGTITFS